MAQKIFIQVIVPVKLQWNPWYYVTEEIAVGTRVRVQLGRNEYVGVVYATSSSPQVNPSVIKPVKEILSELPVILPQELKLWEFISEYYLCTIGEVYKCAYPFRKIKSEQVQLRSEKKALKKQENGVQSRLSLSFNSDAGASSLPSLVVGTERLGYYITRARAVLNSGMSVLVLVPEIEIGQNLEESLRGEFQDRLLVFNSMRTEVQRRKVEAAIRNLDRPEVILATRSALFLPYQDLGLIIVDQEHDTSYKQAEPAPRYNARDLAVMLARIHGAQVILGSSCPSMESLLNCSTGKYQLVSAPVKHPPVEIVDISAERRKRGMKGEFSISALNAISTAHGLVTVVRGFEKEEQTYASLQELLCGMRAQTACDGAQQVPDPQVISAYSARKNLVRSALTVVVQADALFPRDDFRSDEKALQLLTELSARTERLIVQSAKASHPIYRALSSGTYLCYDLLQERQQFNMPPYSRIIQIRSRAGAVVDQFVLEKDANLRRKKQEIRDKYLNTNYIIDVDPQ